MEELAREAKKSGIELSSSQLAAFEMLRNELLAWNKKLNMTTITDPAEIETKHFLDSLTVVPALPADTKTLVDIGSGAGFPGLPIKIVRPDIAVTLIEAVGKKAAAIKSMAAALGLGGIEVANLRAEEAGQDPKFREQFDAATARAVAELRVLAEYALPLVRVGGLVIAQKSAGQEEIDAAEHAIRILGGRMKEMRPVHLPNLPERQLVIIEKISPTPADYPRRPGQPTKKPL